ncbi:hypothetical protein phytr_11370 [Candidatus Phycorickettsia trachydisci]|uniref:Uncharacterized protein n=1 Tax=Candidatus Phycorickettsia trachydisci TaxID=2115978 RepID=A0A2P1P9V1_9RICK|nr:hypothetical protein phytr_11370 [Candidatus Phycorickettsia trachydisci]
MSSTICLIFNIIGLGVSKLSVFLGYFKKRSNKIKLNQKYFDLFIDFNKIYHA